MSERTKVVFRMVDGEVTAVMPELPGTGPNDCTCYAHIGQHSAASLDFLRAGRPATETEYAPLLAELQRIGYNVLVARRVNHRVASDARKRAMRE